MDGEQSGLNNAQVVGLGAAAAGLASAFLLAFGRREKPKTPAERLTAQVAHARSAAADQAQTLKRDVSHSVAPAVKSVKGQAATAKKSGKRTWRQAKHAVADADVHVPHVGAMAASAGADVSHAARKLAGRGAGKGSEVTDMASDAAHKVGEQTSALAQSAQSVAEQAASATVSAAERARKVGAAIAETTKEQLPHVSQTLGEKLTEEVVPTVREAAMLAASTALDLWQTARERAAEAAAAAQHELDELGPQAAHVVEVGADQAKSAVESGEGLVQGATAAVTEKASEVSERAKDAAAEAADATVEAGKNTGSLIFWAGAAAGLTFYALLTPEQRERVTQTVKTVVNQTRELIKDFQGYDEQF